MSSGKRDIIETGSDRFESLQNERDEAVILSSHVTRASFTGSSTASGFSCEKNEHLAAHSDAARYQQPQQSDVLTQLWPLFTNYNDVVDFNQVNAGAFIVGTQYDGLKGNDTVYMPSTYEKYNELHLTHNYTGQPPYSEVFTGGLGDDTIWGGILNDKFIGGAGNDILKGQGGNDIILGDDGGDLPIETEGGRDVIDGGDGNDLIFGGGGSDVLVGGSGDDRLNGEMGSDVIMGGIGNDLLSSGGGGRDFLFGGAGDDIIYSLSLEFHNETISDSLLNGGLGKDTLYALNEGKETLVGGQGADVFIGKTEYSVGEVSLADVITDFEDGVDKLKLEEVIFKYEFSEIDIKNVGNDAVIYNAGTNSVILVVQNCANKIDMADFILE